MPQYNSKEITNDWVQTQLNIGYISSFKPINDPYWDEICEDKELIPNGGEVELFPKGGETELIPNSGKKELFPTAIRKRSESEGTGRITKRTLSKKGRTYVEYWYDWQFFKDGKRVGRSRYIPKKKLCLIQEMESQKLPIKLILLELQQSRVLCSDKVDS